MASPLDPVIDAAREHGRTGQDSSTPSGDVDLTRDHPAWADIEVALQFLDELGYEHVRECIEALVDDSDITLRPDMDENGRYETGLAEELYLDPDLFPSLTHRYPPANEVVEFSQTCRAFDQLVTLAATLFHECVHVDSGILDHLARRLGGKILDLDLDTNDEEGRAHFLEAMLVHQMILAALDRGLECCFLKRIIDSLEAARDVIEESEYGPFYRDLIAPFVDDWKAWVRTHCPGAGSGRSVVDWSGVRERWHRIDVAATCECDDPAHYRTLTESDGWPFSSRFVAHGGTRPIDAPRRIGDCVLVAVFVDAQRRELPDSGPFEWTVTGDTRFRFEYRCERNLHAQGERSLGARLDEVGGRIRVLDGAVDTAEEELQRCRDRCAAAREAAGRARRARAGADARAAAAERARASAEAERDRARQRVDDLEEAARAWDAMSLEERDALRARAAKEMSEALDDLDEEGARAGRRHQRGLSEINRRKDEWRAGWQARGSAPTPEDMDALDAINDELDRLETRYRQGRDRRRVRRDEWMERWRDVDARRRAERELPGARRDQAAAEATARAADQAKEAANVAADQAKRAAAAAQRALERCRSACRSLEALLRRLEADREGARELRRRLEAELEEVGGDGTSTPDELEGRLAELDEALRRIRRAVERAESRLHRLERAERSARLRRIDSPLPGATERLVRPGAGLARVLEREWHAEVGQATADLRLLEAIEAVLRSVRERTADGRARTQGPPPV